MDYGTVEVTKGATYQAMPYHPVHVSVSLRLPLEAGETPQQALQRVSDIVQAQLDVEVNQMIDDGFKWAGNGATVTRPRAKV